MTEKEELNEMDAQIRPALGRWELIIFDTLYVSNGMALSHLYNALATAPWLDKRKQLGNTYNQVNNDMRTIRRALRSLARKRLIELTHKKTRYGQTTKQINSAHLTPHGLKQFSKEDLSDMVKAELQGLIDKPVPFKK